MSIILRDLKLDDAELMLEWMHDKDVVRHLETDFSSKNIEDCKHFIKSSLETKEHLHQAIVDDVNDVYLGTVSLKHISFKEYDAEFAITISKLAMGKNIAAQGMHLILSKAKEIGLKRVYWCVKEVNLRAVRFYDKNGYCRTTCVPSHISEKYANTDGLIWYIWE